MLALSMRAVVNYVMENLENPAERLEILLQRLPVPPRYKSSLVASVLQKIYSLIPPQDWPSSQQSEMIPLLKFCIKTSGVFCYDGFGYNGLLTDYCDDTMSNIISKMVAERSSVQIPRFIRNDFKLDDDISLRSELIDVLYKDKDVKLSVIHYTPRIFSLLPKSLPHLVERNSHRLISLKLFDITLPKCIMMYNLKELFLFNVRFHHEPTELTNMRGLSILVLACVRGIPDEIYKKLTCKLTLQNLEKIDIHNNKASGFEAVVRNYGCNCIEQCLSNLTWLGV